MKKIFILLTIVILSFTGCAKNNTDTKKAVDNDFLSDVVKATNERWNYLDQTKEQEPTIYLKEGIQKESDILNKYISLGENEKFNDDKLKKIAQDYIDALNIQLDSLKYFSSDYTKFTNEWAKGYDKRSKLLVQLADEYGVKIDEKQMNEYRANVEALTEKDNTDKEIKNLVESIKFDNGKTESNLTNYQSNVENTTKYNLESLQISVKLLDKNGSKVSDELISVENWNKGEKKQLEFSTDKKFDQIKLELGDYSIKQ